MNKFKALYKGMYDDLKDSDMMIGYAYELKKQDCDDTTLADEFAKYAEYRLNHFSEFHKMFLVETEKEKSDCDKETVSDCMWHETHKMMQEWCESIKRKIENY